MRKFPVYLSHKRYYPFFKGIVKKKYALAEISCKMLFFFGGMKTTSLIFAFICCAGLFALSAPLQILLLQNAKGGELLGAAGGQIAFNLGSAVGAYCGGMMLTLGLAYNYVALPAALLSFAAMSSLLLYGRYKRQQAADSPVLAKPLG